MAAIRRRNDDERVDDGLRMVAAIERYRHEHGIGISFAELRELREYSSKDKVKRDVDWLVEHGWVEQRPRTARSLRATQAGLRAVRARLPGELPPRPFAPRPAIVAARAGGPAPTIDLVPIVPLDIAAGPPLDYFDSFDKTDVESWLPLPAGTLRTPERCFAIRVRGDSMSDAHILDGDLVVLRSADTADSGQIVAVVLPDRGVALKRYMPEEKQGHLRFRSENPAAEDIDILVPLDAELADSDDPIPKIIGTLETLYRDLNPR